MGSYVAAMSVGSLPMKEQMPVTGKIQRQVSFDPCLSQVWGVDTEESVVSPMSVTRGDTEEGVM